MNDDKSFNDYATPTERRHLLALQNLNIGANGRWFMLALVAIALHQDKPQFAFAFALILGSTVILEQLPGRWRMLTAVIVYAISAFLALAFAVFCL